MHDLNQITRLNAEAFADAIQSYRRQARWVLAKYEGLHLASIETFTSQDAAQAAFEVEAVKRDGGGRAVLFTPIPDVAPVVLPNVRAPSRPADKTLGDYITRKSALLDNPEE